MLNSQFFSFPAILALRAPAGILLLTLICFGFPSPVAGTVDYSLFDDHKLVTSKHFEIQNIHGLPIRSFDDLIGRPVLLYWLSHSNNPELRTERRKEVSRFNELARKYESRGLIVMAILGHPKKDLVRVAQELGINHPYAQAKSTDATKSLSGHPLFRGSRDYVLINAHSRLKYRETPGQPPELFERIDGRSGFVLPVWEWPKSARKAASYARKRRLGAALKEARRKAGQHPTVVADLVRLLDSLIIRMYWDHHEGHHWRAHDVAKQITEEWKGIELTSLAEDLLNRYKRDETLRKILVDDVQLNELWSQRHKGRSHIKEVLLPRTKELEKRYLHTAIGRRAKLYRMNLELRADSR